MTGAEIRGRHRLPDPDPRRPATAALIGVGVALLAAGSALGLVLSHVGAAATGELALDEWLGSHRPAPLRVVGLALHHALGEPWGPLAALCVAAVLLVVESVRAAVLFTALLVASAIPTTLVKLVVRRPRPPVALVHALVDNQASSSFPSSHTAFAAVVVAGLLVTLPRRRARRVTLAVGIPATAVVGAARLIVGAHYLGDVVGSLLLVAGSTILVISVVPWAERGIAPLLARARRR